MTSHANTRADRTAAKATTVTGLLSTAVGAVALLFSHAALADADEPDNSVESHSEIPPEPGYGEPMIVAVLGPVDESSKDAAIDPYAELAQDQAGEGVPEDDCEVFDEELGAWVDYCEEATVDHRDDTGENLGIGYAQDRRYEVGARSSVNNRAGAYAVGATAQVHISQLPKPIVRAPSVPAPTSGYVYRKKPVRQFEDFWSYVGAGVSHRTVILPLKNGQSSEFNYAFADVRGGVVYKKTFGIEARLGTSTGSESAFHICHHGQGCSINLRAPLVAGIYARLQSPVGIGRLKPYGVLGLAYSSYDGTISDYYGADSESTSHWDVSYGIGLEFAVTKLFSIGGEYMRYGHDDDGFGINARYMF